MVKSLNGGAAAHRVLTDHELDDQKLFSRGMALIKSTASYISQTFYSFESIIKRLQVPLSPK